MPEGHTIHRLARDHKALLAGRAVSASSPQGRFATGAEMLTGRVLKRIEPYGKHLFYGFEGEVLLHVHLGLYGKWTVHRGQAPEPKGALRLRLTVAADGAPADGAGAVGSGADGAGVDGSAANGVGTDEPATVLDLRGPTACELFTPADRDAVLARLGPDPLRKDADPDLAWARLSRSRVAVGALLMDQSVLAGVGNVYRAEVLFRAGLSPFRPGREVPERIWEGMWTDLAQLLRSGVRAGRIVTTEPEDRDRRSGRARGVDAHYVYRRHGLPCRRCGTEVRTQLMVARNLFWCPVCQPA